MEVQRLLGGVQYERNTKSRNQLMIVKWNDHLKTSDTSTINSTLEWKVERHKRNNRVKRSLQIT